jgi:5-methylcytosine-specific restriction endonuclease McrA
MAKLSTLRPTLGALPGRLAPMKKIVDPFYVSPEWRSLVAKIKNERGDRCQDCGSTHRVAGDHVIEIKDGGAKLDPGNVRLRCAACHNRKTIEARKARQRGGG